MVTQHNQEATKAEMDQLSSMPLSQIEIDDSGPPIVHYGTYVHVAASTPTGTDIHMHSSQQDDSYQQIIPGIPQGSLYPTLSSLSLGAVASDTNVQSICDKVTKGLDKYLQDTEQLCALEVNYFDDTARPTSTSLMSETTEQVNESSQNKFTHGQTRVYRRCRIGHKYTGVSKDRHQPYFMTSANTEKYITALYRSR